MKWKTYAASLLLGGCIAAAATAGALATDPIKEEEFGDYFICHPDYAIQEVNWIDGSYTHYQYDKQGNVTASIYPREVTRYTNTYNEKGQLVKDEYTVGDEFTVTTSYWYDEDGKLVRDRREDTFAEANVSESVYDAQGRIVERNVSSDNDMVRDKETYTYDSTGYSIEGVEYHKREEQWVAVATLDIRATYDAYGNVVKKDRIYYNYDTDETIKDTTRYEYTYKNGKVTSVVCCSEGEYGDEYGYKYLYDDEGIPIEIQGYTSEGTWEKEATIQCISKADLAKMVFPDVPLNAWYDPYVRYAYEHHLMAGTRTTTFEPQIALSRAMVTQILYNRAGQPSVSQKPIFTDVPKNAWYFNAVQWAAQNHIVGGVGNNQFAPNANVTREQLVRMLYSAQGEPKVTQTLTGFEDTAQISSWASDAMNWAVEQGIVHGSAQQGKLYLNPKSATTRAEAATIFTKYDQNF